MVLLKTLILRISNSTGNSPCSISPSNINNSTEIIKNYRGYVDVITNGIVINAKRMAKNSEDINQIIDYVSETLKKKLAHETTIKLKELYPNLDEDKIEKLNKLFKEN